MKTFNIKENDEGKTLLKYLEKMMPDVPKSRIEKALRNKDVKLNDKRDKDKKTILKEGDVIVVYGIESETRMRRFAPIQQKFTVQYEDDNILVVNKEAGVVTNDHPQSLDNQVLNYLKFKQTSSFVPSSIGRLDKVTSGLVAYAKNYQTLRQMKEKQTNFEKIYTMRSDLKKNIRTEYKLMHDENYKREMVANIGKIAITEFFIEKDKKYARIITGRKHQIRASLSKLGVPIYGDRKYGGKPADRVYLHCFSIKFKSLEGSLKYLNGQEVMSIPNW